MSDESIGVYEPNAEAGQPSQVVPEQPKNYVTTDDLATFGDNLIRRFQSMTDQDITKRIKREVESFNTELSRRVEAARNAGIVVTDAQQQAARDQFTQKLLSTELVDETPAQVVLQPQIDPATVKRVNLEMARLQAQYGYVPDETDAEFHDPAFWKNPNPEQFLESYKRNFEKLAKRLGLNAPQPPQEPPEPGVRLPVQGGSAANQQGLMEQYRTAVARAGSVNERLKIRQDFRARGLEI